MNVLLKAIVDELVSVEGLAVDAMGKKDFSTVLVPDLISVGKGVPAIVANYADLKAEIAALSDQVAQQDLESYILGKVVGTSAKAQAIIAAVVDLVNGAEKLYVALKM